MMDSEADPAVSLGSYAAHMAADSPEPHPTRCTAAASAQTSKQHLHIYALYAWKDGGGPSVGAAPAAAVGAPLTRDLPRVELYLRSSAPLQVCTGGREVCVWVVMCYVMSTFASVRPAAIPRGRIDLLPTHVRALPTPRSWAAPRRPSQAIAASSSSGAPTGPSLPSLGRGR